MADDYQVTPARGEAIDGRPAPKPTPGFPEEPAAARAEIEATRARMSETIDEIEDVLLRKKEKIRDQLDVLAPVREEPVKMLAMIFGGALVLGLLTAGGKKSREHHIVRLDDLDRSSLGHHSEDEAELEEDDEAALAWERAEAWEDRAHRLLRIAKAQEAELEIHRSRRDGFLRQLRTARARDVDEYDDQDEDFENNGEPNLFDRLRETAATRLAGIASEVSHRMMRGA